MAGTRRCLKEIENMAILEYEKKHEAFRTKLRDFFAKEVTPYAAQWEKDHIVPREAWTK